jgi:hypothetical protein
MNTHHRFIHTVLYTTRFKMNYAIRETRYINYRIKKSKNSQKQLNIMQLI